MWLWMLCLVFLWSSSSIRAFGIEKLARGLKNTNNNNRSSASGYSCIDIDCTSTNAEICEALSEIVDRQNQVVFTRENLFFEKCNCCVKRSANQFRIRSLWLEKTKEIKQKRLQSEQNGATAAGNGTSTPKAANDDNDDEDDKDDADDNDNNEEDEDTPQITDTSTIASRVTRPPATTTNNGLSTRNSRNSGPGRSTTLSTMRSTTARNPRYG